MIDLTGANLVAYLMRIIRDVIYKNPRFRNALGDVTYPMNSNPTTALRWKDVQVIVKSVTTSGNRFSPDYFMCTQIGRAILAKVADKDGLFVEWIKEVDPTHKTPQPGVYYMNVDFVDERTRDIGLTVQKYTWAEGNYKNAVGSIVYFKQGLIDPGTSQQVDLNTIIARDGETGELVQFTALNSSFGGTIILLTPVTNLVLYFANGMPLARETDYWYQRNLSVVVATNISGQVLFNIPEQYVTMELVDQTGYVWRPNIDYTFYGGPQWVHSSQWTPPGTTVTANLVVKVSPLTGNATNPENVLNIGLQPGSQTLAPNQVVIQTSGGTYTAVTPNPDGTVTIPQLLQPGDNAYWSFRIDAGQFKAKAKKYEVNSLTIVDPNSIKFETPVPPQPLPVGAPPPAQVQVNAGDPMLTSTGQHQYVFPGLWLAIGDNVFVGDQAAILISPTMTETHAVYGTKENLTFTLEFKSNDLQTSSEMSEMVKQYLLITSRKDVEADGLTIYEMTRDFRGEMRDPSGTATNYVYDVSCTAAADWKVYKPLVTRLLSFEISQMATVTGTTSRIENTPRMTAFGASRFIPAYV